MRGAVLFAAGLLVCVSAVRVATPTPLPATHGDAGGACGDCHAGSVPFTHTEAFVAREHGEASRAGEAACLRCHDADDHCADCHLATSPDWETDGVRHPAEGSAARDEHAEVATAHASSCMTCHAARFRAQCADCHRPDELLR